MNLSKVSWPVFPLGNKVPEVQGSKLIVTTESLTDAGIQISTKIIDDKSIKGDTLGRRRLNIKYNLFPLKMAIYFLADFIKVGKINNKWFIDNVGNVFKYTKSTRAPLKCFKIKKIIPGVSTGAIVEVEGLSTRFKVLYIPNTSVRYAGVLVWGKGYILYGLFTEPFKDTWRKI